MNLRSAALTRRAFLGGAGAAVAVTAAHSAVGPFLPRPLEVAALIDGEYGLAGLEKVFELTTFDLRAAITSSPGLRSNATRLLSQKASGTDLLNLPLRHSEIVQLPDTLLIFGLWDAEQDLLPLLRARNAIFIDNPLLGIRISQAHYRFRHPELSFVGMTSVLDPLVEHVEERIRSGVVGELQDCTIATRKNDLINIVEGIGVARRVSHNGGLTKIRKISTRNLLPGVLMTCSRGQLHVPFYSPTERLLACPLRLQHFASVARGDTRSAMSLLEIGDLATGNGMSLR
jgi:hypothetical protein